MKQIKTKEDVKRLGTILTIWAHPDDESFLAAGILTVAVNNGQKVVCLTATKGELGVYDDKRWPAEHIDATRAQELRAALHILGIREHHWLGYIDGKCTDVQAEEATDKIATFITEIKPNSILTFGPDGWTGHPDHQAVSRWVETAVNKSGHSCQVFHVIGTKDNYEKYLKLADEKVNIFFNIDKPPLFDEADCDICFHLPKEICDIKCNALEAMPSQTHALFKYFDQPFLKKAWSQECFSLADKS